MPAPTELTEAQILNRVFVAATNRIAIGNSGASGDNSPVDERSPQAIWNAIFDAANNVLNF